MTEVHVIGAGLAGLSAAVRLSAAGHKVHVYEAAPRAGGRCRSFHDAKLDCVIDNGNHLLMSANRAALSYLAEIGASDRLEGPRDAAYPFIDLASGERWTVRLDEGRFQRWIFDPARRIPGTHAMDYFSVLRLLLAGREARLGDLLDRESVLYRRFWEPLILAALNTAPEQAAASLLRPVLLESFARGAAFSKPLIAKENLDDTLVAPALARLEERGAALRFGCRIDRILFEADHATALVTGEERITLARDAQVLLAVPPFIAATLLPGLSTPEPGEAIVNVHFRLPAPLSDSIRIFGVIGGICHWIFLRRDVVSATISAADHVAKLPADEIAATVWGEIARTLDCAQMAIPPVRVIKEKRATFSATPESQARRPGARTSCANLFLAGDWTATGLPATIEGAIRSGQHAAALIAQRTDSDNRTEDNRNEMETTPT